jgi:hypothetical protein
MSEEQRTKWMEKMVERYGSEEEVRAEMARRQKKSREKYKGTGGFKAMDPERIREISKLGVLARSKNAARNLEHTDTV